MKPIDIPALLKRIELRYILKALKATQNNRSAAAKLIGINRTCLVEKMRAYGILDQMPSSYRRRGSHANATRAGESSGV